MKPKATEPATGLAFKNASRTIRRTLKLGWQLEKSKMLLYALGALLEIAGTLISTYASARLISLLFTAVHTPAQRGEVWLWLAASIGGLLAINLGFWLMSYSKRILYILASSWSSMNFMNQLSTIDIRNFYDTDSRNTINKLDNGHAWRVSIALNDAMDLLYGFVRVLAIIGVLASLAWWLVPLLIIFLIPSLVAESKTAKAMWFVWDEKGDERHVYWGIVYLMGRAAHQLEIRALQAKKPLLNTLELMINRFQNKERVILRSANKAVGLSKVFEIVGITLTEVWLLYRLLYRNNLSISSYIFYSAAIARVNGALNALVGTYTNMQEALLYSHDFYKFMELKPVISADTGAQVQPGVPEIKFKDVWFKYPGSEAWVFQGLSFTIKPGEHIALIGENGAGKTTIVKLLLRFYEVTEGSIEINGQPIEDISLASWYKQLGTLFQQFNQYPLDVQHNVIISDNNKLDEAKLKRAMASSGLDDIVDKLPYGLETVLESSFKKGVEPSGGQWQRVALARAFYRDANVLILDEPTAAIDARAEYKIFNNIFTSQAQKTTIIISHRFSTVRRAGRIIVLDEGKIIEEGSHASLMKVKGGLYRDLFEKQAEGYR